MCLSVTAVCIPGDLLALMSHPRDPSWLYSPVFIRLWPHREREQPQYALASRSHCYMCLSITAVCMPGERRSVNVK